MSALAVRISGHDIDRLRRLAEDLGTKPTVLARQWILEHLDAADDEDEDDEVDLTAASSSTSRRQPRPRKT
jgi:phage terminase small subunit